MEAIKKSLAKEPSADLQKHIIDTYDWEQQTKMLLEIYKDAGLMK